MNRCVFEDGAILLPAAFCAMPECRNRVPVDPEKEGWQRVEAEIPRWICPGCVN